MMIVNLLGRSSWRHIASRILGNIDLSNGLLLDGTKPLSKPVLDLSSNGIISTSPCDVWNKNATLKKESLRISSFEWPYVHGIYIDRNVSA